MTPRTLETIFQNLPQISLYILMTFSKKPITSILVSRDPFEHPHFQNNINNLHSFLTASAIFDFKLTVIELIFEA